jgi:hypothetical protein
LFVVEGPHLGIVDHILPSQAPEQLKPGQLAKRKHQITDVLHQVASQLIFLPPYFSPSLTRREVLDRLWLELCVLCVLNELRLCARQSEETVWYVGAHEVTVGCK